MASEPEILRFKASIKPTQAELLLHLQNIAPYHRGKRLVHLASIGLASLQGQTPATSIPNGAGVSNSIAKPVTKMKAVSAEKPAATVPAPDASPAAPSKKYTIPEDAAEAMGLEGMM